MRHFESCYNREESGADRGPGIGLAETRESHWSAVVGIGLERGTL